MAKQTKGLGAAVPPAVPGAPGGHDIDPALKAEVEKELMANLHVEVPRRIHRALKVAASMDPDPEVTVRSIVTELLEAWYKEHRVPGT